MYPEVRIELVTATTGALVSKIAQHELDAAFVAEPFATDELDVTRVFREDLVLIAPRSFPRLRTPRDIGHTTLIAFAAGCSYRRRLESWLGTAQLVPERVMEFGSYHAIVACVAAGAGIAVVPRSVIQISLGAREVGVNALPPAIARAWTCLVRRRGAQPVALEALGTLLRSARRGRAG
jgi:DNA-binding transcriptional LysR family regulator